MATGSLASLGLGSENVLSSETLEKLKKAEESARIKPYETKIEANTTKQKALTELTTKLSAFQTAVSSLGDATAFSKRKVTPSVTGDSAAATLTASNGVSVQNLSVKVDKIAQKDVFQSKGLVKDTDRVLTANQQAGSFIIRQNGKDYKINVDSNMTYEGLAERINSVTSGNVIAKIVSTGEAGTPYRLTLSSKETGADNAITFRADDTNGKAILSNFGWNLKEKDIAEADLKGYSFSGGSKAGSVTNLSDNLTTDVKFTLFAGTEKFEIDFKKDKVSGGTATYQDLINEVNTKTGGKVQMTAATDGSSNKQIFNFVAGNNATSSTKITLFDGISTTDTSGNKTYTSDSDTTTFFQTTLGIDITKSYDLDDANGEYHLKKAQNAEFTLDGVKMYRSKNNITDVGAGITLNLLKAGEINFDIKQDTDGLKETMEELVEKYNELMNYLDEVTAYNTETKVSGDLADVREVKTLRSSIMSMLFDSQSVEGKSTDENGNTTKTNVFVSVLDYGLSLNEANKLLKFDSSKFEKKIAEDIDFAERFFSGTSGFEEVNVIGKAKSFDGTDFQNGLDFKGKDFKLTFGDKSYDLTKTADGKNDFKLDGTDAKERAQKLLDHINSFGISGLKVTMQELTITESGAQVTGYALKFKSDDGSDFEISGDKDFLAKLGLEAQKINPEVKKGTGIFSELKSTLQSYTRLSTSDTKKGSLTLYGERLTALNKALNEEKTKDQTKIDNYYEAMFSRWVQYDSIIASIKTQGNAITQMINAAQQNNK